MELKTIRKIFLFIPLLLLTGCLPVLWPAPPPGPVVIDAYQGTGPTVAMIGDSITSDAWGIKNYFGPALRTAGYSESITGLPGYSTPQLKPWADLYAPTNPHVFLINLGTNDVVAQWNSPGGNYTLDLYKQRINAYIAEFPNSCVVVTTITAQRPLSTFPAGTTQQRVDDYNAISAAMNVFLRTKPHVADWDAALTGHPEYLPDGIHPYNSLAGLNALTSVLLTATQQCQ